MFGNLRPRGLPSGSKDRYQASFCGSCHALAEWGRTAALATNYDITLLHLVLASLENAPFEKRACTALPFSKVGVRELSAHSRQWLAAFNLMLMGAKCRDDIEDERSWKGRLGLGLLGSKLARAEDILEQSGFPSSLLTNLPTEQRRAERKERSLEEYALPTSRMLGEAFAHTARLTGREQHVVALRRFGQSLATLIYIRDAQTDREQDTRKGRFNALVASGACGAYVRHVTEREFERAVGGLAEADLGEEGTIACQLLEGLVETPEAPVMAAEGARRRRKKAALCGLEALCCEALCSGCADPICAAACSSCGCSPCDCCCYAAASEAGQTSSPSEPNGTPLLSCPACGSEMNPITSSGIELDECSQCYGLWFDKGELEAISRLRHGPPERLLRSRLVTTQLRPEGTRPCPRCAQYLVGMKAKGIQLDICQDCQGLWLDQGELNALLEGT